MYILQKEILTDGFVCTYKSQKSFFMFYIYKNCGANINVMK